MFRVALVWAFCLLCVGVNDHASARPIHGGIAAPSGNCPQGTSYTNVRGTPDGCLGAPTGTPDNITLFQNSSYFASYANQNGQTYINSHPPSWNVAGVDYPVGIPGGTVFKDPATATLPSGCVYSATGSSNNGPKMTCTGSSNPTFDGYDFSGTLIGSHGCVLILFSNNGSAGSNWQN